MNTINPKIIIMDLDGTLLDKNKDVSSFSISILEKCKKNGIKLAFATARTENASKRIMNLIKPDFLILNDGALIKNEENKIIHKKLLTSEVSDGIINICIKNNQDITDICAETEYNFYRTFTEINDQDWNYGTNYDFSKPLSQEVYKISIETLNEKLAMDIENQFNECKLIYNIGENWYRYTHKEVGKMNGVEIISKELNIPISEIIAFGDDYNDIEMVKNCGIGIAMENGLDKIKEVAKYICKSNNEEGVCKWIEENIL